MSTRDANNDGRLCDRNESNPVTEGYFSHFKFVRGVFGHDPHLMFSHGAIRLVFDAGNFAALLVRSHRSPKNDYGPRARIVSRSRQIERKFGE